MSRETLTGSRIRERRLISGFKQAELARRAGISASYLNLIEHNRRRIGGKLLLDIAAALEVEPMSLSEGAEAALLGSLREVAALHPAIESELERVEEFAGRFPGWASLIDRLAQRQSSLEQTVVSLTDRMTHDPQLAESLHDMLGAVTAIRSTSSILVETDALESEWRDRFQRNINEDAKRLTEGSQALVAYLNSEGAEQQQVTTPQDEIEAFFRRHGYHFEQLERGLGESDAKAEIDSLVVSGDALLVSASAREQVQRLLTRYWQDAQALNSEHLRTLTMRKPLPRFALPRFGAACPLWTLYQALSRPLMALRETAQLGARDASSFETLAIAAPMTAHQFGAAALLEAHMLIIPLSAAGEQDVQESLRPIGISCRICPRESCAGRREPSILASGV